MILCVRHIERRLHRRSVRRGWRMRRAAGTSMIGRGHAERLVPMIDELLDGRKAEPHPGRGRAGKLHRHPRRDRGRARPGDRLGAPSSRGMSSLALLAAGATAMARSLRRSPAVTASCSFSSSMPSRLEPTSDVVQPGARRQRPPLISARLVVGSGAKALVDARGWGEAREAWPSAANALALPRKPRGRFPRARSMPARPTRASRKRPDGDCASNDVRIDAGSSRRPGFGDARHGRRVRRSLRRGMDALATAPESCRWRGSALVLARVRRRGGNRVFTVPDRRRRVRAVVDRRNAERAPATGSAACCSTTSWTGREMMELFACILKCAMEIQPFPYIEMRVFHQ